MNQVLLIILKTMKSLSLKTKSFFPFALDAERLKSLNRFSFLTGKRNSSYEKCFKGLSTSIFE